MQPCVIVCAGGCVSVYFVASDAHRGSSWGREGHLRATVIVKFCHPGAAHHTAVGVCSSVCLSVPETPDVTLWTDRKYSVGTGIYCVA